MKENVMTEDGQLQCGPLLSFTMRSFQFNLDLGRDFFSPQCIFIFLQVG